MQSKGNELITLAQCICAMSQTALTYSSNEYEIDHSHELIEINRIASIVSGFSEEEINTCYVPVKEYVTPKVDIREFPSHFTHLTSFSGKSKVTLI